MAALIPAIGTCRFDTAAERRLAERLEQKLDDDYLLWHNVPVGPKQSYPDFVVIHPRRGALILETKDWHLGTIVEGSPNSFTILDNGARKSVASPLAQARHCALQVITALQRDPQLIEADGPHKGKLAFPWGHGVVFTRITRKQFDESELANVMPPHLVICQDEMLENADPEEFQQRLWNMFPHTFSKSTLTLPQLDRIRWIMFPQVRVPSQASLFDAGSIDEGEDLPDIMRVMDLQQEQLARSMGDGHRVIHGVAGSGKTMILGYRAEQLALAASKSKPVLVLCFNEPLAVKLDAMFVAKGIADRVHARHFHKWCRRQLVTYNQPIPQGIGNHIFDEMVDNVIRGVDRKQIPAGQYLAVLIDEGHDFHAEWFKLITQMVDPTTSSLLVLYDSAQNIYDKARIRPKSAGASKFSFSSVGIQARGRTTILKINYRNTRQILQTANAVAAEFLRQDVQDEDGAPLLQPVSCGREGPAPIVVRLPTLRDEAMRIADLLESAHAEGHAWGDMAVLCRTYADMDLQERVLGSRRIPHEVRRRTGDFQPLSNAIKIMTMQISKGLEFPVIAMAGAGHMPMANEDVQDEARLFYVAATRATHRLIVGASGPGAFTTNL